MISAAERAALAMRDAHYLKLPLELGSDPSSMAAHLRQVVRLLGTDARAAVTYLTGLYDRSITPRSDLACARGCAYCCVQTVVVTAAEAFAVAAEVSGRVTAPAAWPARRLGEPKSDWRPCPFLGPDKSCGVYEARPLGCHGFVSFDLQHCIEFFAARNDDARFTPADRQQVMYVCRMMLCAAHLLTGHGEQPGHELTGAVAAILAQPDAEVRWHAGENVLRDVPVGPPIPPGFAAEIRRMADYVAPTI